MPHTSLGSIITYSSEFLFGRSTFPVTYYSIFRYAYILLCHVRSASNSTRLVSNVGSPWLLAPQFQIALDALSLRFKLFGTNPTFKQGHFEKHLIRTAPLSKREGQFASEGEVMAFLNFFPNSLTSVPVQYMHAVEPSPRESAIVKEGLYAGSTVALEKKASPDGFLMGTIQGTQHRVSFRLSDLVAISRR